MQRRSLARGRRSSGDRDALAALYSTPVAVPAQPKPVKVAVIVPFSGPWARTGTLVKFGAEIAVDEINEKGGIASLGGAKLELVSIHAGRTLLKKPRTRHSVSSRRSRTSSAAPVRGSRLSRSP